MSMREMWRAVIGYPGYEVSNLGRVRSLERTLTYSRMGGCSVNRRHRGLVLRPGATASGHMLVVLGYGNPVYVHRLVLEAFVGSCPDGLECCHNDGDPTNNRIDNLRWDTRSSNIADAYRHGARKSQRRRAA